MTKTFESAEKVRENRLRRMAQRQGLLLEKSRLRDTRAIGYGTYRLSDPAVGVPVARESGYGMSLDQVERVLNG